MRGMDACVSDCVCRGVMRSHKRDQKRDSSRRPASEAEVIDAWLDERCSWGEDAPQGQAPASDLFADYCAWRKLRRGRAATQTAFGRHLRARGIGSIKSTRDGRTWRFPIQLDAPGPDALEGMALRSGGGASAPPNGRRSERTRKRAGWGARGAGWKEAEAALVDRWLSERCIWGEAAGKGRTPAADLFSDFVAWSRGQSLATVTQTAFGLHLRERGIMGAKRAEGGRVMRWPIQFSPSGRAGLAGADLDPRERSKARRLAAMPAADVYAAFKARAG